MPFPSWVDFESAEWSAAVMARGLSGPTQAWGTLLAHSQAVIASRTDGPHTELHNSYDFAAWRDLVAAARILDLAATDFGIKDSEDRKTAAILAACAFGMSGTAVSATAVIRGHRLLESGLSPGELTALALSSPIHSRTVLPELPEGTTYRACVENVTAFLSSGSKEHFRAASTLLQEATYEELEAWEGYLLRLSKLSLSHAGRLATASVLGPYDSSFPTGYLDRLVADSPLLLPSQYEAIKEHGVLVPGENLLITLPTGTGKTLLGELAILSSLGREPGLVCYIAPYVALGRQVAERISSRTPHEVGVHRLIGSFREPDSLDPMNRLEVIVATPERFDAMLRFRPDLLSAIRCVVFDEAHLVGNDMRGVRLEGILTRLRLASLRGERVPRFVLLSAVLSNADALANWIGIAPGKVIRGTWRPSAKRLMRWTEDGMLRLHAGDDPLRDSPSEVLGEARLPWPNREFYPAPHYGAIRKQEPLALENVAFLADHQYEQYEQPVLCVCSTRSKTRRLAAEIAQRFSPLAPLPQSIRIITELIDRKHKFLRPLKESLLRGVAYHNSSLPHDVREAIERAVETRTLRVVAATTTLAEGVDLPFRVTILADWLTFDGDRSRPMESLLFHNIAGRCGRAGQFTEGDTVVFDNPVGDSNLTAPYRRLLLQGDIFFADTPPVLKSAIGQLDGSVSVPAVGTQLLAAIAENPDDEELDSSFLIRSFANQTDGADLAAKRIAQSLQEILDRTNGQPLALAASPVRLTPFGEAANRGGLSPGTARNLRSALGEFTNRGSSRTDLLAISVALLRTLAFVPEQRNPDLRKAVAAKPRSRPVVKLEELELVLSLWLAGESLESIFASIPTYKRSKRHPRLNEWLKGLSKDSSWNDTFAKFHDFISQCFEFFLPWILRASQPMAEIDGEQEKPWSEWARFVENGVGSSWGSRLIVEGAIGDRKLALQVGQQLDTLGEGYDTSLENVRTVLSNKIESDQLEKLLTWLRTREEST